MKYRLKDRELQKALDKISDGDFTKQLNALHQYDFKNNLGISVPFGKTSEGSLYACRLLASFDIFEIEEVGEYNPYGWNDYPEVTPPEGEWMRVEFDNRFNGNVERHVAKYIEDGGKFYWVDDRGDDICNVDRFRPWED